MEKSQSPSQQQVQTMQAQAQPALQITQEQYQQLTQQLQLQQAFANSQQQGTIHVKQEFQTQQQQQPQQITAAEFKQLQDQQMQQMQIVQAEQQSQNNHANSQAAAAQAAIQQAVQNGQIPAEWQQQRVQVLQQQPMQNAQYLQHQIYSPQLVMSGNILHGGLGQPQQIQLIAAGKPFQNQLLQQMQTANGKTVSSFGGYTMPSNQNGQQQTVLFNPVQLNGVINSQAQQQQQQQQTQQSIMSNMQNQQTPTKSEQKPIAGKNILQKVSQAQTQQQSSVSQTVANQGNNLQSVQVSQTMPTAQLLNGQTMQFASPWITQGGMPFWNNLQQPIQLASPILIRGTNPDGTPTFIQQSPQQQTQQTVLSPLNREYREYLNPFFFAAC